MFHVLIPVVFLFQVRFYNPGSLISSIGPAPGDGQAGWFSINSTIILSNHFQLEYNLFRKKNFKLNGGSDEFSRIEPKNGWPVAAEPVNGVDFFTGTSCRKGEKEEQVALTVKPGVEVLLEKRLDLLRGKRVGLITNPSGVDRQLRSTARLLKEHPEVNLVALYGPEHGIRGNAQAGEYVPFYFDDKYELPVFSLYGQSFRPEPGMLKNIDEYMRSFDTQAVGKIPDKAMIENIEVLVFDIQDVGTRVYTYIATMAYAMEMCAELGIDFIVLDRPNPITGLTLEGAVLKYPEFRLVCRALPDSAATWDDRGGAGQVV